VPIKTYTSLNIIGYGHSLIASTWLFSINTPLILIIKLRKLMLVI